MFLGGCPCCGKKGPCWRCYGRDNTCEAITETCRQICTSEGVTNELWKSAFSIRSATMDTDSFTPLLLNAQILAFDTGPSDLYITRFNRLQSYFNEPVLFSVYAEDPLGTQGAAEVMVNCNADGSFDFAVTARQNALNPLLSVKKEGLDLPNQTTPFPNQYRWEWNSATADPKLSSAGTYIFLYSDGTSFDITVKELLSGGTEYQCFDAPPDEEGWKPVGKCHATEEECAKECVPCWRCYEPCDGLIVEIEVIGLEGDLGDPYNVVYIDDTTETGIPIGTLLRPWRSRVDSNGDTFLDYAYASPNASRPPDLYGPAGSTVFGGSIKCSGNNLVWDVGDKTWEAPDVPLVNNGNQFNLLRGELSLRPFGTGCIFDPILSIPKAQLENNGTYPFSHSVKLYTEFDGSPTVASIQLLARVMNPGDAAKNTVQCFLPEDAPPTEDGWTPVGDCHKTQAECEAECGTTKRSRTMPTTTKTTGPGTHLAKTLASWGFKEGKGCSCKKMSRLMDGWGSACAKDPHLTTIVDHLEKEAKKRKLPFVRKLAEALIKRAVRQSENQS